LVDDRFAVILGARYLFAPAHVGACEVHYRLPEGWQVHHPSGARRLGPEAAWEYPSYEILLDTPVVFGRFDTLRRDVSGTPFYFVFLDRAVGFESESGRFADAVARVVEAFHGIFGAFPFDDYTFVLSLNPNNDWGLEHLTSTMVAAYRGAGVVSIACGSLSPGRGFAPSTRRLSALLCRNPGQS
jgi:predicted metalloprotease with PDZ domain